ncbi:MAG: A/G-specific adenine glycosylase [Alkalilacustris sp.]
MPVQPSWEASILCDEFDGRADVSRVLLSWYDRNARDLPWRVGPATRAAGVWPDPYRVWLSEVMLQQTTVAAVRGYFARFVKEWPTVGALAAAPDDDVMAAWAGLGYYARARNLLRCARMIVDEHDGQFPRTVDGLRRLPGVGPYTAAAIAAIAFDAPGVVVDGNVERVVSRLFCVEDPLPDSKPVLVELAGRITPSERRGDHAQAMMDLGATVCTPRAPACGICPVISMCAAHRSGLSGQLPYKRPKPRKPTRRGHLYLAVRRDGALLLERRPDTGLLGGMMGFPGSDWAETPVPDPPLDIRWRQMPEEVRHTFTHFHLHLTLHVAKADQHMVPKRGMFVPAPEFRSSALPTVMRKAFELARHELLGRVTTQDPRKR